MVVDSLSHLQDIVKLHPLFSEVVRFVKEHDLRLFEQGSYNIKGDDVYLNIDVVEGKTPDAATLEVHRRMIDIQIPLTGTETYGYTPLQLLPPVEFDEKRDIAFFHGQKPLEYVTCLQGMFVIFFPQDAHAPCISKEKQLKKAVFKVKY